MSFIKRLEESEGPIKIGNIPMEKIYVDSLLEEIKTLRQKLAEATATGDGDTPVSKIPCPFCGELPMRMEDEITAGVFGEVSGWLLQSSRLASFMNPPPFTPGLAVTDRLQRQSVMMMLRIKPTSHWFDALNPLVLH